MLELKHISKTFNPGTIDEKAVFDDFNLTVNDSDFITIVGSNGAGKSTLFNLISGTFITDTGTILLDGKDITFVQEHERSRKIGRLFQDPRLGTCPDLTILENMGLAYLQSRNRGLLSSLTSSDKKEISDILAQLDMGLENRLNTPIGLLSGGQRQALTLLMATLTKPQLLLLDEHTAALDPQTAEKVIELTKKIVEENKITTLMITHNMNQAITLGNRIIMMKDGKIVYDVQGEEKKNCTMDNLLLKFKENTGESMNNDRIVLS